MHRRARSQPTIPTTTDVHSNRISSSSFPPRRSSSKHHREEETNNNNNKTLEIYRGLQVEFPKFYEEMLANAASESESSRGVYFWRLGSSIAENSSSIIDSHQEARILNCIGNIHFQRQEFDLACEAYVLAKECYEKLGEEYTSAVAVTLSNIGTVAWRSHVYEAAQEFFEESLRILMKQKKGTGETDDMIADAHHNLGLVKSLMEDYKGAKESLEKALHIRRQLHGKFSAQAARTLDVLGTVYMKIENKSVAMIYYSEALFTKKQVLGEEHPSTLISLMNVASVYKKNGELDHALSMYEKVLELQRKRNNTNTNSLVSSGDPFSLEIGITMHTIADIKLEKMSLFGALSTYRDAGDIYKKAGLDRNDKRYVALRKSQLNAQKLLQTTQTQLFLIREQSTGGNY